MKRRILLMLLFTILVGCNANKVDKTSDPPSNVEEREREPDKDSDISSRLVLEGTKPVNRALAAKMVALAAYSKSEIGQFDREILYTDTDPTLWFDSYINIVTINDWFPVVGETFRPFDLLTYSEAKGIVERLELGDAFSFEWKDEIMNQPIQYKDWFEVYESILQVLDIENDVVTDSFVLVGTPANIASLKAWELLTDKGKFQFEGLAMDQFMDNKIKVLRRNQDLLGVLDIVEENPIITNVWIEQITEEAVTVFVGGAYRKYEVSSPISHIKNQIIADVHIVNQQVTDLEYKEEIITGRVLRINNAEVLIEGLGAFSIASDRKVYSTHDSLQWRTINQIIVGYSKTDFVIKDGIVQAAIIKEPVSIENIRVLLRTTGFKELVHQTIEITSDVDFTVQYDEEKVVYEKGKVFKVNPDHAMLNHYLKIYPNDSKGRLEVLSVERAYGTPIYRGTIEIAKASNGLYLINELPMEEYLYAVVPSEMPTSYGIEASKVQAICARSFAYSQFYGNSYAAHGAHVDDSVASQVYNNYRENETSIKAVNETNRLGLKQGGSVVSAYYFSTSSGHTANSGDVWANWSTKDFPTSTAEYVTGKPQFEEQLKLDLSKEEDFATFIKEDQYKSYDQNISWYRWQITMTKDQLEKSIVEHLEKRYLVAPKLIKVLGEDDKFRSRPINSIGELEDIIVYSRGNSGIITEILIVGTENTVKVATEYNIRFMLAPKKYSAEETDVIITRKDGSTVKNQNVMPSAFFTMDKKFDVNNGLESITFYGGGYGHGVGMSQNGVKGMVDRGYTYDQILRHFYTNVEIEKIY